MRISRRSRRLARQVLVDAVSNSHGIWVVPWPSAGDQAAHTTGKYLTPHKRLGLRECRSGQSNENVRMGSGIDDEIRRPDVLQGSRGYKGGLLTSDAVDARSHFYARRGPLEQFSD